MTIAVIKRARGVVIKSGVNSAEVRRQAEVAEAEANRAEVSAATAVAASGPNYASTAAGLAATSDGEAFAVDNGDGTVTVYLNDAGSAVAQRTLATTDFLAGSTGAAQIGTSDGGTAQDSIDALEAIEHKSLRPVYVEQRIDGLFGRGMLDAEADAVVSDQEITNAPLAAGASSIQCADPTKFDAGSPVAIEHSDGTTGTYFVQAIGASLAIRPTLQKPVAVGGRVERVWWNRAHPGKAYMKWLAEKIAYGRGHELAMPSGDATIFSNMESNDLSEVSAANVTWLAASNVAHSTSIAEAINRSGRVAYVDGVANGDGVETELHPVAQAGAQLCRVRFYGHALTVTYTIRVVDQDGIILGKYSTTAADQNVTRDYTFAFETRAATSIKVQILAESGSSVGNANHFFTVAGVWVFPAPDSNALVIPDRKAKIVALGDSWVAGDTGTTPERVGLATQLAAALPEATVINEGVGGEDLPSMLARWQTSVLDHSPDYVVVVAGTNDSYSPSSGTFDPTARNNMKGYYRDLISKAEQAGIKLILVGPPGLAQNGPAAASLAEWELNDRAGAYARDLEADAAKLPTVEEEEEEVGFRGALVKKAASQNGADFTTEALLSWDAEDYDTDGFHDNAVNPARLTIPVGVSKVRLSAALLVNNVDAGNYMRLRIYKNESSDLYTGMGGGYSYNDASNAHISCQTAVLSVTPGDFFDVRLLIEADTSVDVLADPSWFSIEVLE